MLSEWARGMSRYHEDNRTVFILSYIIVTTIVSHFPFSVGRITLNLGFGKLNNNNSINRYRLHKIESTGMCWVRIAMQSHFCLPNFMMKNSIGVWVDMNTMNNAPPPKSAKEKLTHT